MNRNAPEIDCIALALAFFRTPSRFPDLLHGRSPLPRGLLVLLQAATGHASRDNAEAGLDAAGDEVRQAARFFIEQVLLAHNASHYRVLGVAPAAPIEEIKEHHRLLMRLFHPDRHTRPDRHWEAMAMRINQAYTVLRTPAERAKYDATLATKPAPEPPGSRFRRPPEPAGIPGPAVRLPPVVARHLPQFALGSVALMGVLGVALVYLNRPPPSAIGSDDARYTETPRDPDARAVPSRLPSAVARALAEAGRDSQTAGRPATESRPVPVPATQGTDTRGNHAQAVQALAAPAPFARPEAERPTPKPAAGPAQSTAPTAPRPPASPTVAQPLGLTERPAPPAPSPAAEEARRPSPSADQLNSLVASLAERYQRGDLDNLLALFDASAHIEHGDKSAIRAEYGELFSGTESRDLYIWDMAWSDQGGLTRGEGSFQARVLRKGDAAPKIYNGWVTIEVVQRNDRPLIVGLYHRTSR